MSEQSEVRIRRAPKLPVFLVLGALLGFLVTLFLTSRFTPDPHVGFLASFGYFLLFGIPAGVALGATIGLIIDAVSRRRSRLVTVEHEVVGAQPESDGPESHGPDRFVWLIEVSAPQPARAAQLPDAAVQGPWRRLVDRVREQGDAVRPAVLPLREVADE